MVKELNQSLADDWRKEIQNKTITDTDLNE
jgi:hypothetical protein